MDYKSYIDGQYALLMARKNDEALMRKLGATEGQLKQRLADLDWLAIAIREIGTQGDKWSVALATKRLAVKSRGTLYRWIDYGLESAPFGKVLELSKLSGVPIEQLATRLGPRPAREAQVAKAKAAKRKE